MKIYTKNGDKGKTRLLYGDSVSKDNLAPEAYGSVDELVASLGIIRAEDGLPSEVEEKMITDLEEKIDQLEDKNGIPDFFVVPGENAISSKIDWSRVVSRRAERKCVTWQNAFEIEDSIVVKYLNRLSDYLWMLARDFEKDWTPSK
jgi:cob(I)alamin adenosyltransferase